MESIIFVRNEEESRQVQEALFSVGFGWQSGYEKKVKNENKHFLFVYSKDMDICYSDDFVYAVSTKEKHKFFNSEDVIDDPMIVDGAKKPEKMITIDGKEYSESTIKNALREYVG